MPERHNFSTGLDALEQLKKALGHALGEHITDQSVLDDEDFAQLVSDGEIICRAIAVLAEKRDMKSAAVQNGPHARLQERLSASTSTRAHRGRDGALDFVALETVRAARANRVMLQRQKHLDVLRAFAPDINLASIPPKLGKWRKQEILTWIDRSPQTIDLGAGGLRKMKELYDEAEPAAEAIETVMQAHIDSDYSFPDLGDLR